MGIPRGVARLLLDEARERPFAGTLLQLGRSSVYVTERQLRGWAQEQGVTLRSDVAIELSHDRRLAAIDCLSDRSFFELLGFERVRTLDASPWEGAEILHDLNRPVPDELRGRFDAVFEAGTIQHVFALPDVLANIHRLLRVGGRSIHGMTTSNNHVDHGFYMFSPTLFHDYYAANRYRIETELFFEFTPIWVCGRFESARWKIYRYEPGCIDHLSYGGFGRRQIGLFVVATRLAESTADVAPQQGYYGRFWEQLERRQREGPRTPRLRQRLELQVARRSWLAPALLLWKRLRAAVVRRLPQRMPPVYRRY